MLLARAALSRRPLWHANDRTRLELDEFRAPRFLSREETPEMVEAVQYTLVASVRNIDLRWVGGVINKPERAAAGGAGATAVGTRRPGVSVRGPSRRASSAMRWRRRTVAVAGVGPDTHIT